MRSWCWSEAVRWRLSTLVALQQSQYLGQLTQENLLALLLLGPIAVTFVTCAYCVNGRSCCGCGWIGFDALAKISLYKSQFLGICCCTANIRKYPWADAGAPKGTSEQTQWNEGQAMLTAADAGNTAKVGSTPGPPFSKSIEDVNTKPFCLPTTKCNNIL